MNDKGTGAVFCLASAILTSARYLSAAVYMSGSATLSGELFASGLTYVGAPLRVASLVSLLAGIAFLGRGLYRDLKGK